jgi:hypothetical protein
LTATALDRGQRHPEGLHDLSLRRRAIDHELGGEKAKAGQILDRVAEDRQVAIEINHLPVSLLKRQFRRNRGGAIRKQG